MPNIKAVNNFIFIIRDEEQTERNGLILPDAAVKKPHTGIIFSVGKTVKDMDLKKGIGKRAIWHQHTGQKIEYEGDEFIVLPEEQILGIDEVEKT